MPSITPSRKCPSRRPGRPGLLLPTNTPPRGGIVGTAQRPPDALHRSRWAAAPKCSASHPLRLPTRNEPMMPRVPRSSEAPKAPPIPRAAERITTPPPPPPTPIQPTAEQNLAEMAQRLEAALRRPAGDASEPRIGAPPVAPEPPPVRPAPPPRPSHRWRRRCHAVAEERL